MKKLTAFGILLLFVFLSLNFIACSSDEDKDNPQIDEPQTPEDNLPEEAKSFVGYWINNDMRSGDWLFFRDGMCWCYGNDYWTYDASTKILATSFGTQWQVTLSNADTWSGLLLGSNKPQSFRKEKNKLKYMKQIFRYSSWADSSDSILVSDAGTESYNFYIDESSIIGLHYIILSEDENTEDYTFKYAFHGGIYNAFMGEGTVTLKNPEYLKNSALVFTGYINKTMVRFFDE